MKISILGTGAMGTAMGTAIINAGHELVVYNRTMEKTKTLEEKGAKVVASVAEAISEADVSIFVMVNGEAVKEALLNGDTLASVKNKMIINTATSSVNDIAELLEAVTKNGGRFAEISMLTDPNMLHSSSGTFNLGCNKEDTQFLLDVLSTFIDEVKVVGEIGDVAKVQAFSLVESWISLVATAYSVATAQKLGIKPEVYEPVINVTSPLAEFYTSNMTAHNYDNIYGNAEGFAIMGNTIIDITSNLGIPTEVLLEIQKLYEKASQSGYSKKDASAILEVLLKK